MKVYIFYLRGESHIDELYAYTDSKKYRDMFLIQRNPKMFTMKKVSMSRDEFDHFSHAFNRESLQIIPLSTEDSDIYMVMTILEETSIEEFINSADNEINDLYKDLVLQSNFPKKYISEIEKLCTTYYYKETKDGTKDIFSRANMFRVFVRLYGNTLNYTIS